GKQAVVDLELRLGVDVDAAGVRGEGVEGLDHAAVDRVLDGGEAVVGVPALDSAEDAVDGGERLEGDAGAEVAGGGEVGEGAGGAEVGDGEAAVEGGGAAHNLAVDAVDGGGRERPLAEGEE